MYRNVGISTYCAVITATLFLFGSTGSVAQNRTIGEPGTPIHPSEYIVRSWTTADGLPVNHIGEILQTSDGYLWLATGGGLVRFDGVAFKVFTPAEIPGWTTSYVRGLFEDREGSLWILSMQRELTRWKEGRFETYTSEDGLPSTTFGRPYEDHHGDLWIATQEGLTRFAHGVFTTYTTQDGLPSNHIWEVYEDEENTLWVVTDTGLASFEHERFTAYEMGGYPQGRHIRNVYVDSDGILWLFTEDELVKIEQGKPRVYALEGDYSGNEFWFKDRHGFLWFTSEHGLIRFRDGQFITYPSDGPASALYEDSEGTLWIGTERGIVTRFKDGVFMPYPLDEDLGVKVISHFYEDAEGILWVGTDAGLLSLTPRTFQAYTTREGLMEDMLMSIYEDRRGAVWLGTWGGGLNRIKDNILTVYTTQDGLLDTYVRAIHEDHAGNLWVGTQEGVIRLPDGAAYPVFGWVRAIHEDRTGTLWVGADSGLLSLRGDTLVGALYADLRDVPIRAIYEDRDANLWVATIRGLFRLKEDVWKGYTTDDGLSSNHIVSIYEEKDGTLWFGTFGGGLNRFKEEQFFVYTTRQGLFNDGVWLILEDEKGNFWMCSGAGVFRVSKQELDDVADGTRDHVTSVAYTEADGLPSAECNAGQPAGLKAQDGRLWFPTMKGAAVIDPNKLRVNKQPPPVHIEEVIVNGQPMGVHERLELAPESQHLLFHYTALSFTAPERNRFRYRLEGYDTAWREAGANRTATYTNLDPGSYTFRVIAANNDGIWNEEGASLTFYLKPFFYETFWFRFLSLVVAGLIIGGAYRYHVKHLREMELEEQVEERTQSLLEEKKKTEAQAAQLEEMDQLKSRFFANISHEFRTPLSMILGPIRDLLTGARGTLDEDARRQLEIADRNARHMERLIDQLIDLSRLEASHMELELRRGDLVAFVREIVRSFAPLAERKRIMLQFRAERDHLPLDFDAEMLEKVIGNLLSNALKFTPEKGRVRITLEDDEKAITIRVRDTGIGISAEKLPHVFDRFYQVDSSATREHEGVGIGLSLAKELVELHGGTIHAESEPGFGAEFIVTLPCVVSPERDAIVPTESAVSPQAPTIPVIERESSLNEPGREVSPDLPPDASTVLLVEDNADVRAYLRAHLESSYQVEEARNGLEALEKIYESRPDVIVSDVMMPEMDGIELCRTLKGSEQTSDIPIILLTARAGEADTIEGLETGADDYIKKPFDIAELEARIKNVIQTRHELRRRFSREVFVQPGNIPITSADEAFLERACALVEAYMDKSYFNVEVFAQEIGLSRSQLTRKLRAITGMTPAVFIRHLRLLRAAQLLEQKAGNVSEVAYAVGFNGPDYFSHLFREQFGTSPSEYRTDEA